MLRFIKFVLLSCFFTSLNIGFSEEVCWKNCQRLYAAPTHQIAEIQVIGKLVKIMTTDGLEWTASGDIDALIAKNLWKEGDQLVLYVAYNLFRGFYWLYCPRTNHWIYVSKARLAQDNEATYYIDNVSVKNRFIHVSSKSGKRLLVVLEPAKIPQPGETTYDPLVTWKPGDIVTFGSRKSLSMHEGKDEPKFIYNVTQCETLSVLKL